jgi:hypothetical protein
MTLDLNFALTIAGYIIVALLGAVAWLMRVRIESLESNARDWDARWLSYVRAHEQLTGRVSVLEQPVSMLSTDVRAIVPQLAVVMDQVRQMAVRQDEQNKQINARLDAIERLAREVKMATSSGR